MKTVSPSYAAAARRHLSAADPVLARIIEQVGAPQFAPRRDRFRALVRAIVFQQLAGAAAQAIYDRFVKQVGGGRFPSPARVLAASEAALRAAGLSRAKTAYIRDLAAHVRDGVLNFHRFARMEDEEIIADLTRVKGIGRWTAEVFLMFHLHRPDVLPVGDLGFRNAVTKAYGIDAPLNPKELHLFGERWRPYRSAAVWYLWQSLRLVTPGDAAPAAAVPKSAARPTRKRKPSPPKPPARKPRPRAR